jgi:hypothetical protein
MVHLVQKAACIHGRFLQTLREKRRPLTDLPPPTVTERLSSNAAVWLFIRVQSKLTELSSSTMGRV